jgi:hypothetical protein
MRMQLLLEELGLDLKINFKEITRIQLTKMLREANGFDLKIAFLVAQLIKEAV